MTYLGNAFSLQMLDTTEETFLQVTPVRAEEVATADFVSVIVHADTANVVAGILNREV